MCRPSSPRADGRKATRAAPTARPNITPETYNGSERGAERFVSPQPLADGTQHLHRAGPTRRRAATRWSARGRSRGQYVRVGGPGVVDRASRYAPARRTWSMATADGQADRRRRSQVDDRPPTTVTRAGRRTSTVWSTDPAAASHTLRLTAAAPASRPSPSPSAAERRAARLHRAVRRRGRLVPGALPRAAAARLPRHHRRRVGRRPRHRPRPCRRPLMFVLGFATVFAGFGVDRRARRAARSRPCRTTSSGSAGSSIIVFGLALLGVVRGPAGPRAAPDHRRCPGSRARSGRSWSAWRSGRRGAPASGRCWAPRSWSPPAPGSRSGAALLLLSYALGIGVPFLVASLGLASSPRLERLAAPGRPEMERVAGAAAGRPRGAAGHRRLPDAHLLPGPLHPRRRRALTGPVSAGVDGGPPFVATYGSS